MNRQAIFDTIAEGLLGQMEKCVDGSGGCLYQLDDGKGNVTHCGIGFIIPDGHEAMDSGDGVTSIMKAHSDLAKLWEVDGSEDRLFLSRMQRVHDSHRPNEWEGALRAMADTYDLEFHHV